MQITFLADHTFTNVPVTYHNDLLELERLELELEQQTESPEFSLVAATASSTHIKLV